MARRLVNRDAGLVDDYEENILNEFYSKEPLTKREKFFGHVLRLIRRNECSDATINNIKRLSSSQFVALVLEAYKHLNPAEWVVFGQKLQRIVDRSASVTKAVIKIPFGAKRPVQKLVANALRTSL